MADATAPPAPARRRRPVGLRVLRGHLWLVYGFLYVPIAVLVLLSFNRAGLPTAWGGFSVHWYGELAANTAIQRAALNTLIVAVSSTLIASLLGTLLGELNGITSEIQEQIMRTRLGTLLALAVERRQRRSGLLDAVLFAPMIIPDIILAIALLSFFTLMRVTLGLHTIVIAHVVFNIAFVCAVVRTRLKHFDYAIVEASIDLGAGEFTTFRRVTLPMLMPGILGGALLAFTLSLDDFVITFFTSGAGFNTLPVRVFGMIKRGVTPEINAVSTVMLVASFLLIIISIVPRMRSGEDEDAIQFGL